MPPIEKKEIKPIDNKKMIFMFLAILVIASLIYVFFFKKETEITFLNNDCFTEKQRTIDGSSMSPLFKDNEVVTTFENYYACNEIKKGDIVIFNFKTREGDYIKKVLGMPNDLLEIEDGNIKINGEFVLNSEGIKYSLNKIEESILIKPLQSNQIPRNGYLVLGDNVSEDTFDSRKFGYISKDQIIGKVKK